MPLKKSQRSLKDWGKQKWRTSSGKPSKGKGNKAGKQFVKQPKKIAKKTRSYR